MSKIATWMNDAWPCHTTSFDKTLKMSSGRQVWITWKRYFLIRVKNGTYDRRTKSKAVGQARPCNHSVLKELSGLRLITFYCVTYIIICEPLEGFNLILRNVTYVARGSLGRRRTRFDFGGRVDKFWRKCLLMRVVKSTYIAAQCKILQITYLFHI